MPAHPIKLAHMQFAKKGDAVAYLKEILGRYDLGDRVSAEDAVIVRAALDRHPNAKAKIGSGVTHFSVRSAEFRTKCFWVNRTDGTTEKFSVDGCIYGS